MQLFQFNVQDLKNNLIEPTFKIYCRQLLDAISNLPLYVTHLSVFGASNPNFCALKDLFVKFVPQLSLEHKCPVAS